MPGPVLPNTGIQLPALDGDAGVWDSESNACWGNYDEHDHTPGNGVRIPVAGINIDEALSMAGFGLQHVGSLGFDEIAVLAAGARIFFVNAADHELYYRTAAGANVKFTSGPSLNLSLVGGIVGDYAAVGAEVAYDAANSRYTFKQQGVGKPWARLASADVRLYEFNTTEAVYTALKVAPTLAASYEITLPVALPATAAPFVVDAAGTGTFGAAFAMGVNQNITLSGTGALKTGNQTITGYGSPTRWFVVGGAVTTATGATPGSTVGVSTDAYLQIPDLPVGARLQSIQLNGTVGGGGVLARSLYKCSSGGILTAIPGATSASHVNPTTLTPTNPAALAAGELLFVRVTTDAAVTADTITYVIVFDIP